MKVSLPNLSKIVCHIKSIVESQKEVLIDKIQYNTLLPVPTTFPDVSSIGSAVFA